MPPRKRTPVPTVAPRADSESPAAVAKRFARSINARKGFAGTVVVASEMNPPPPRLSTGSLSFDAAMGGGFPVNQWSEIVGKENSGKSSVALKTLGAAQARDFNYVCCWVASESFDAKLAEACGVDLTRVWLIESNDMEFVYNEVIRALEDRAFDMVVIDSYSALVTTQENDKTMEEFTMGGAKVTNQFFRKVGKSGKRSLTDTNDRPWVGILVNQWRSILGVIHGDPRTTSGGQGKNYAAYCRLDVKRDEWITDPTTKEKVGQVIKIVVMKMKGAPPQQVGVTDFYFRDCGEHAFGEYDTFKALLSLAEMFDVITRTGEGGRGGSFVDLDGNRYQGREKLIIALRADPGQRERIESEVLRIASKGKVPTEPEEEFEQPTPIGRSRGLSA